MLKKSALIFGAVLMTVGILGFIPGITQGQHLFGVFHVNPFHNIVHLLSGAIAIVASYTSWRASKIYFQVFGCVYGLVAILGLIQGETLLFGVMSNNLPITMVHIVIALVALTLGFAPRWSHRPIPLMR